VSGNAEWLYPIVQIVAMLLPWESLRTDKNSFPEGFSSAAGTPQPLSGIVSLLALSVRMQGRTWKGITRPQAEEIRVLLSRLGDADDKVSGTREVWRIRVEGSVFTFYETGTLYFNGGVGLAETVANEISKILQAGVPPSKLGPTHE